MNIKKLLAWVSVGRPSDAQIEANQPKLGFTREHIRALYRAAEILEQHSYSAHAKEVVMAANRILGVKPIEPYEYAKLDREVIA